MDALLFISSTIRHISQSQSVAISLCTVPLVLHQYQMIARWCDCVYQLRNYIHRSSCQSDTQRVLILQFQSQPNIKCTYLFKDLFV